MKVRNKSKKNMKIFREKIVMESWYSVLYAVDVDIAYDNFVQIIDNLHSKYPIIIKSERKFFNLPWMTTLCYISKK